MKKQSRKEIEENRREKKIIGKEREKKEKIKWMRRVEKGE